MQVWERAVGGREHRVEVEGSVRRHLRWYVDGELVAEKQTADDHPQLEPSDDRGEGLGVLSLRFSGLGAPRRATLHDDQVSAVAGLGGTDLVPEPGSPAARHEERLLAHPQRYALRQTAVAVAIIAVPLLLGLLLRLLEPLLPGLPSIPWPNLPNLPDLPSIPRPDLPNLPSIPWPDLPDVAVPGWVERVLDVLGYVWPVLLAYLLAHGEVRRRKRRDEAARERSEDPRAD